MMLDDSKKATRFINDWEYDKLWGVLIDSKINKRNPLNHFNYPRQSGVTTTCIKMMKTLKSRGLGDESVLLMNLPSVSVDLIQEKNDINIRCVTDLFLSIDVTYYKYIIFDNVFSQVFKDEVNGWTGIKNAKKIDINSLIYDMKHRISFSTYL